jgi:hypothetical protein
VPGIGLLDRIHRQRADRIDAQLIKRLTHRFLPVLTGVNRHKGWLIIISLAFSKPEVSTNPHLIVGL